MHIDTAQFLAELGDWAWNRHGNVLSWYVRPLFLIPLAWFAHRRSGWGITGTLVALATSMFWFPAPAEPDPRVQAFLEFEKAWLTGDWNSQKILMSLLAPLSLAAYCLAFWRRSSMWGLVILNLMVGGKLLWGVVAGDGTGWAMTAPALAGLLLCDAVLVRVLQRLRAHREDQVREPAEASPSSSADSSGSAALLTSTSRTST
ncbi:hypothetical protein [Geodermatophilus sp. CPCC 205761]|uniref:hypothetical protein n=1 Tax=Geodermatophilus sp. CPCC 205761 TaxID=2936597 RepID=UPI003EEFBCE7